MPKQVNNSTISNASPKGQAVRRAIDRFHTLSEAWIEDAIKKHEFKGNVSFVVHIKHGMIQVVEPSIEQTVPFNSNNGVQR